MASMWLLDLDEEVSALRRASRRRVVTNAADEFSVFAGQQSSVQRRFSVSRDSHWDKWGDSWLLDAANDFPSSASFFGRVSAHIFNK